MHNAHTRFRGEAIKKIADIGADVTTRRIVQVMSDLIDKALGLQ